MMEWYSYPSLLLFHSFLFANGFINGVTHTYHIRINACFSVLKHQTCKLMKVNERYIIRKWHNTVDSLTRICVLIAIEESVMFQSLVLCFIFYDCTVRNVHVQSQILSFPQMSFSLLQSILYSDCMPLDSNFHFWWNISTALIQSIWKIEYGVCNWIIIGNLSRPENSFVIWYHDHRYPFPCVNAMKCIFCCYFLEVCSRNSIHLNC